jgi:hypothetical protein
VVQGEQAPEAQAPETAVAAPAGGPEAADAV